MSERILTPEKLAELEADVERARLFREFAGSPIWKKHLEPFLYKLQQEAEATALTSFRTAASPDEVILRGGVASGRAQAAEEFALFIVRGINDAKEAEKIVARLAEEKLREAAK